MKRYILTVFILVISLNELKGQTLNFDEFKSTTPGFVYTNNDEENAKKGVVKALEPIWVYGQESLAKRSFAEVKDWYTDIPNSIITIKFMPPVSNQGGYGYCYTYAYGTLLKQFKANKANFTATNCLPTMLDISELALTRIMHTIDDGGFYLNYEKPLQRDNNNTFQTMLVKSDKYISSSSKPYENLGFSYLSHFDNRMDDFSNFMHKVQEKYNNKNILTNDLSDITTTIAARMGWATNLLDVKGALNEKGFDKFTNHLLFNNAIEVKNNYSTQNAKMKYAPTELAIDNLGSSQPLWFIKSKIKEVLTIGSPLYIVVNLSGAQTFGHCVVICGYKKVQKGSVVKECYKIQNSYGESWQHQNADGWVDAETLLRYMKIYYVPEGKYYGLRSKTIVWFGDEKDFLIREKDNIIYRK